MCILPVSLLISLSNERVWTGLLSRLVLLEFQPSIEATHGLWTQKVESSRARLFEHKALPAHPTDWLTGLTYDSV
ncbi:hypothetical protein VTH06DRAFT_1762 [Thermothelomyces fergusii]